LNPQPADYKSAALPIELRQHTKPKHRNRFKGKNQPFFGSERILYGNEYFTLFISSIFHGLFPKNHKNIISDLKQLR
jgi:hypothetical protein